MGVISENPLVNRKQFTSTLRNDLIYALERLHNDTRIPKSKLHDEAVEDLLKKYECKKGMTMNMKKIYKHLAKQYHTTPREIEEEIQKSILMAFTSPCDEETKELQQSVPRKGNLPTPEEFIRYITEQIRAEQK